MPLEAAGEGGPPGPDPYQQVVSRDQLLRVNMRTVLVLRYFDDLPDAEIAAALRISESTVWSQAARALAELRSAVAEPTTSTQPGGGR